MAKGMRERIIVNGAADKFLDRWLQRLGRRAPMRPCAVSLPKTHGKSVAAPARLGLHQCQLQRGFLPLSGSAEKDIRAIVCARIAVRFTNGLG